MLGAVASGVTAANTVPPTRAGDDSRPASADDLKPSECASITVTATIAGEGRVDGGAASELIATGAGDDSVDAGSGDDCVLGGDGDDKIKGGPGHDICIGGAGKDTFQQCEVQIQ